MYNNKTVLETVVGSNGEMESDAFSKERMNQKNLTSRKNFLWKMCGIMLLLLFQCCFVYGQAVQVAQVATTGGSTASPLRIAGICVTEDIGGVEVVRARTCASCRSAPEHQRDLREQHCIPSSTTTGVQYRSTGRAAMCSDFFLIFENFNDFTVSVVFQYTNLCWRDGRTGTGRIVLRPNERRETADTFTCPGSFILIATRLSN